MAALLVFSNALPDGKMWIEHYSAKSSKMSFSISKNIWFLFKLNECHEIMSYSVSSLIKGSQIYDKHFSEAKQ